MKRLQRAAVVLSLTKELRAAGSWCGETHVQKAAFALQALARVPTEYGFILYRYGPFSFDLRDELTAFRADGLVEIQYAPPYGPRLLPSDSAQRMIEHHPKTMGRYRTHIAFVADRLGPMDVAELERVGTALHVTLKAPHAAKVGGRAKTLCELKSHIGREEAEAAVRFVDSMREEAAGLMEN